MHYENPKDDASRTGTQTSGVWRRAAGTAHGRRFIKFTQQKVTLNEDMVMSALNIRMELKSEPGVYIADGLIIWIGCSRA